MKLFGLIGYPLIHSYSQLYFYTKFNKENINDVNYKLFPLTDINELPALIASYPELAGFNVTIPHKKSIFKYLDEIDETASEVGAVNAVSILTNNNNKKILKGYNTDICGFESSFITLLIDKGLICFSDLLFKDDLHSVYEDASYSSKVKIPKMNLKALVLGTGGAAKAICFVLKKHKIDFALVSRLHSNSCLTYNNIDCNLISRYQIIINTTPLGMYPDNSTFPLIPYEYLTDKHLVFDLVYNPETTMFLSKAKEQGAITKGGIEMFRIQAEHSWKIWNNKTL